MNKTVEERFWDKVDRSGGDDTCWAWLASLDDTGYGHFRIGKKQTTAHRIAWELTNGKIPEGMSACHHCDNRSCMNPAHLFLGTLLDNMQDRDNKGRQSYGERNHFSKLTWNAVRDIRCRFALGHATKLNLAAEFDVDISTIIRIISHKTWRGVLSS